MADGSIVIITAVAVTGGERNWVLDRWATPGEGRYGQHLTTILPPYRAGLAVQAAGAVPTGCERRPGKARLEDERSSQFTQNKVCSPRPKPTLS